MNVAARFIALAIVLGMQALPSASGAEEFRIHLVVLDVPAGGLTPANPALSQFATPTPTSTSTFAHPSHDIVITAMVADYRSYDGWHNHCTRGSTQPGKLARTDEYGYSRNPLDRKGALQADGPWLEYCLTIRAAGLSASITLSGPRTTFEKGVLAGGAIEKFFASARLSAASFDGRGAGDPRITLELPDGFAPTGPAAIGFVYEHNELTALRIEIFVRGRQDFEESKKFYERSSNWKAGKLARTDEYLYYVNESSSIPSFDLLFRSGDIGVVISIEFWGPPAERKGLSPQVAERILASARILPAAAAGKQ